MYIVLSIYNNFFVFNSEEEKALVLKFSNIFILICIHCECFLDQNMYRTACNDKQINFNLIFKHKKRNIFKQIFHIYL